MKKKLMNLPKKENIKNDEDLIALQNKLILKTDYFDEYVESFIKGLKKRSVIRFIKHCKMESIVYELKNNFGVVELRKYNCVRKIEENGIRLKLETKNEEGKLIKTFTFNTDNPESVNDVKLQIRRILHDFVNRGYNITTLMDAE